MNKLLGYIKRQSSLESSRLPYLDGWRGLAISLVLIDHFAHLEELGSGRFGVDIFFVLSGLLMSNILFIKRVDLLTFYRRRLSRIVPAFLAYVCFIYGADLFCGLAGEWQNFFYSIFFLRTYFPAEPHIFATGLPISHFWSLNVEEHSYIILSLFTLPAILRGREFGLLFVLGAAAILLHYSFYRFPEYAPTKFDVRTETAISHLFLSAGYFLVLKKWPFSVPSWLPLVSFALALLCYTDNFRPHWTASWSFSPLLLAITVNHLKDLPSCILSGLSWLPLRLLGLWSYSIYLWQQPFFNWGVGGYTAFSMGNLAYLLGAVFAGFLSFTFLENPLRNFFNKAS